MARHLISGDAQIRAIKPGDSRKRLGDGDGLYLLLFVKGGAHGWRLDYSINGRRKTLSLGTYPGVLLSAAREKADKARERVAQGVDPSDDRKAAKEAAVQQRETERLEAAGLPAPGTFEAVAREWWETIHAPAVSEGHAERMLIRLQNDVFPFIGRRPLAEIEPPELLAVLRKIEARGAIEMTHRAKDACGQVFRYGIASGYCQRNPAADLKDVLKPTQPRHHAAIVDPTGVAALLRDMAAYQGHPFTRAALVLSALLFMRPARCVNWNGHGLTWMRQR
jgi:hypothetical protein